MSTFQKDHWQWHRYDLKPMFVYAVEAVKVAVTLAVAPLRFKEQCLSIGSSGSGNDIGSGSTQ